MPQISVIVPVYNVENYLHRCIDSILTQSFKDFELILIDDGSTDASGQICDEYAKKDSRIIVIHQVNKGVSSARNEGIEIASAQYCIFVDSDDYLKPNCLYNFSSHANYDLLVAGVLTLTENGETIHVEKYANITYINQKNFDYYELYKNTMMHPVWGKCYKLDIIRSNNIRFNTSISWGEDTMFVLDFVMCANSLSVIDSINYCYIVYDRDSLSKKLRYDLIESITLSREYCYISITKLRPELKEKLTNIYLNTIYWLCIDILEKVFTKDEINNREKIKLLKHYSNNQYIKNILLNPTEFLHPSDPRSKAFAKITPRKMLYTYYFYKNRIIIIDKLRSFYRFFKQK